MTDQRFQRITSMPALHFGFLLEKRILTAEKVDGNYYVLTVDHTDAVFLCNHLLLL